MLIESEELKIWLQTISTTDLSTPFNRTIQYVILKVLDKIDKMEEAKKADR